MLSIFAVLLYLAFMTPVPWTTSAKVSNIVMETCAETDPVCEIRLVIAYNWTMMMYNNDGQGRAWPVGAFDNGTMYSRRRRDCKIDQTLSQQDAESVVTTDGSHKLAIMINGTIPAPPIVVYQHQQVVVTLTNQMSNEGTTLHFHGMYQHNTPWMDGAGRISQCPINPGETFTYRFIAEPAGTHWYHTHQGTQRTMGAYGALIILPRTKDPRPSGHQLDFSAEFILMVSDWMAESSHVTAELVKREAISFVYGFDDAKCFNSTKQADGLDCGVTPFFSAVINGKGNHFPDRGASPSKPGLPLEVFHTHHGGLYRFRMTSASMTFALRVSIDHHPLHVISSDGADVMTYQVESIIVYSGERYDFWINATDPLDTGSYWIRAETLERTQGGKSITPGHVEAILQYGDVEPSLRDRPRTSRVSCTADKPCLVLNCPYRYYPDNEHTYCVPLTELRRPDPYPTIGPTPLLAKTPEQDAVSASKQDDDLYEFFLNYHFVQDRTTWKTAINRYSFVPPAAPPQVFPGADQQSIIPCSPENCVTEYCRCTHSLEVPLGAIVQLVLVTTVHNEEGSMNGNAHSVHLHGQHFQVIKVAWPEYDNFTKFYYKTSPDLACVDAQEVFCSSVGWANQSWYHGNVADIITQGAPLKDTVVIPVGGYVVVRFKADNPGYWYMHCHTEFHNEEGMSLYIKVGNDSQMNRPPAGMNTCGNFDLSQKEFRDRLHNPVNVLEEALVQEDTPSIKCTNSLHNYQLVSIALTIVVVVLIVTNAYLWFNYRNNKGYTFIPSSNE